MKTRIYICALSALFMIPLAVTAQTKKKQARITQTSRLLHGNRHSKKT